MSQFRVPNTGRERNLFHDTDNRLLTINEAGLDAIYSYDANGRRVMKEVNGVTTYFIHAGDMEVAEADGQGRILRYYIPGGGIDQRVAMIEKTGDCFDQSGGLTQQCIYNYHADRLGNVIAVVRDGIVTDRYLYSPFGIEEPLIGSGNPFRYTGRRYDPESGLRHCRGLLRLYSVHWTEYLASPTTSEVPKNP